MKLLPRFYYARRQAHPGVRPSGLILPECAREAYSDAEVLDRGLKARGARVGDRILCAPVSFETLRDQEGFVHDADLLAVIRAPDFAQVEPAGKWVLVQPDPRERVRATSGGVLVASYSLSGDEGRGKQRGYELLLEYARLLESERYRDEPTAFDKHRLEERFVANLSPSEVATFAEALSKQREEGKSSREGVTLDEEDYRAMAPLRLAPAIQSGVVLGVGPEVTDEVPLEARITWSRAQSAVRLAVGGDLVMLVEARAIETVVEAEALLEFRQAA